MADNVAITPGIGATIACDEVVDGTLGTVKVQYVKIMDATLDGTTKAAVGAAGLKVDGSGTTQPVSGTVAATQSGTWTVQPGNTANTTAWKVDNTAALDKGAGTAGSATQRVIVDSSQLVGNGQNTMGNSQPVVIASDQTWPKGLSNRVFVAAFTTLTRPANTTAYTAGDSISNNATAGSVTALSATTSDTNDDPIFLSEILISSTDTGLAGKRVRAYLFNSDPTASTGVGGGDNAAFSQKVAGYIGSFSGRLEAGFSDGTVGRLVPSFQLSTDTTDLAGAPAGGFVPCLPTSGAKTLFIQFQAIDGFTPSANSTTIIAKARGWQGRAA